MVEQEKYDELEKQLDTIYKACAAEYAELTKTKGFDIYSEKAYRKINALAQKYAKYIVPLQDEMNALKEIIDQKTEEERKAKYIRNE